MFHLIETEWGWKDKWKRKKSPTYIARNRVISVFICVCRFFLYMNLSHFISYDVSFNGDQLSINAQRKIWLFSLFVTEKWPIHSIEYRQKKGRMAARYNCVVYNNVRIKWPITPCLLLMCIIIILKYHNVNGFAYLSLTRFVSISTVSREWERFFVVFVVAIFLNFWCGLICHSIEIYWILNLK